jgi:hypothetical protein
MVYERQQFSPPSFRHKRCVKHGRNFRTEKNEELLIFFILFRYFKTLLNKNKFFGKSENNELKFIF